MAGIIAADKSPVSTNRQREGEAEGDELSEVDLFPVNRVCDQFCC